MNFRESFVNGQSLGQQPGFSLRSRSCQKSPLPPFIKGGVGGDFREGVTKHNFWPHFKLSFFESPGDESRTFRTIPKFDDLVKSQRAKTGSKILPVAIGTQNR
jgi:hypothetical protein